jgi:hypothetical protein
MQQRLRSFRLIIPLQRRIVRNHDQMSVICHQTPSENLDAKTVELFGHDIGMRATILVAAEDGV